MEVMFPACLKILIITFLANPVIPVSVQLQLCTNFCRAHHPPEKSGAYWLECSTEFPSPETEKKRKHCEELCVQCSGICERGALRCPALIYYKEDGKARNYEDSHSSTDSGGMPTGMLIIIIVLVIVFLCIAVVPLCIFCYNQSKRKNMPVGPPPPGAVYPQATYMPNPMLANMGPPMGPPMGAPPPASGGPPPSATSTASTQ